MMVGLGSDGWMDGCEGNVMEEGGRVERRWAMLGFTYIHTYIHSRVVMDGWMDGESAFVGENRDLIGFEV